MLWELKKTWKQKKEKIERDKRVDKKKVGKSMIVSLWRILKLIVDLYKSDYSKISGK